MNGSTVVYLVAQASPGQALYLALLACAVLMELTLIAAVVLVARLPAPERWTPKTDRKEPTL